MHYWKEFDTQIDRYEYWTKWKSYCDLQCTVNKDTSTWYKFLKYCAKFEANIYEMWHKGKSG